MKKIFSKRMLVVALLFLVSLGGINFGIKYIKAKKTENQFYAEKVIQKLNIMSEYEQSHKKIKSYLEPVSKSSDYITIATPDGTIVCNTRATQYHDNNYSNSYFGEALDKAQSWDFNLMHYKRNYIAEIEIEEKVKSITDTKKDSLHIGECLEIDKTKELSFPDSWKVDDSWDLIKFKNPIDPATYLPEEMQEKALDGFNYFIFDYNLDEFFQAANSPKTVFIGDIDNGFLEMIYDKCIFGEKNFTWPHIVIYSYDSSEYPDAILKKINTFTKLCCESGAGIRIIYSDDKYQDFEYYVE